MESKKILTLCFVIKNSEVLLGMKKIGFGAGRYNGFGGKVEEGESIEEAAKREVREESGVTPKIIEKSGIINFSFEDAPRNLEVHVFRCTDFEGDFMETEEMKPQWFHKDDIPYGQMWSDDIYWLPLLLAGKQFNASFLFDKPSTADYSAKIIKFELNEESVV